ncbi:MAG: cyanophycin synthetase [Bryobacterales bacterium]|nr:cyanophycin synthetase [Bryobacterales bacterium]
MEFRKVLALRGPNVWAWTPVIEAWVDLGKWKNLPSDSIPGFNDRLTAWLPSMVEHRCSTGKRGGFFERLRHGTYMAHVLEHVALELQALAGVNLGFGRARETSEEGVYKVVFRYLDETLARECLAKARELVLAAAEGNAFGVEDAIGMLRGVAEVNLLGPSTNAIVEAARERHIPAKRLDKYSLVQLGYGCKQRRIRAAETDQTCAIAQAIAQDKDLTRRLLQSVGVPTPDGFPVANAAAAVEEAEYLGYPVVVKPQDGNQGRGVSTNLTTREQVIAAYDAARAHSESVVVETFAPGGDYRLLVIGGALAAAARREPAHVTGDGAHTVRELVDMVNQDPRRADHHSKILSKIPLDDVSLQVLASQGYGADSVPASGTHVLIRRNANLSTGGTATDVTGIVHPDVAARAIEAARIVGLDIAGVDVVARDISIPLERQGGVIVEVNAAPGLRMHLAPSEGKPRPVGEAIVNMLFPSGEDGRIPIAAVTGTNGKTTVTRFIAHILRGTGKCVGMTCTDGIYIDERRIDSDDCSGPVSAGMILANPRVEMAVFETARGGILRAGLGFDECRTAVVTNIADGDHLGLSDIHTASDLAKVKRTIVEVAGQDGTAVLNATDPLVAAMAPYCRGRVLFFAQDSSDPVILSHRSAGGQAIFVSDGYITVAEGIEETPLMRVSDVPITMDGRIEFEIENTLAAVAAALAMGIPPDVVIRQASCFSSDADQVPGRFNVIPLRGGTVIVDYGHNAHSLRVMTHTLNAFPHKRRLALYTMAGDRRDSDIEQIGEMLGDSYDRVILYEAATMRGRAPGEIAIILRQGLAHGERVLEIDEIDDPIEATRHALDLVQEDDILLLQADAIDDIVSFVRGYVASVQPVAEVSPVAVR